MQHALATHLTAEDRLLDGCLDESERSHQAGTAARFFWIRSLAIRTAVDDSAQIETMELPDETPGPDRHLQGQQRLKLLMSLVNELPRRCQGLGRVLIVAAPILIVVLLAKQKFDADSARPPETKKPSAAEGHDFTDDYKELIK